MLQRPSHSQVYFMRNHAGVVVACWRACRHDNNVTQTADTCGHTRQRREVWYMRLTWGWGGQELVHVACGKLPVQLRPGNERRGV